MSKVVIQILMMVMVNTFRISIVVIIISSSTGYLDRCKLQGKSETALTSRVNNVEPVGVPSSYRINNKITLKFPMGNPLAPNPYTPNPKP